MSMVEPRVWINHHHYDLFGRVRLCSTAPTDDLLGIHTNLHSEILICGRCDVLFHEWIGWYLNESGINLRVECTYVYYRLSGM